MVLFEGLYYVNNSYCMKPRKLEVYLIYYLVIYVVLHMLYVK